MTRQTNSTLQWAHFQPERMRPHLSGKTVVAGHTPQAVGHVLDLGFLKGIDTDGCRGGWLTVVS
jgi:serine/threonine protein phosphatase 1